MASPHPTSQELSPATMIRWALVLVLVALVTFFYLLIDFNGLTHAKGMEQAQIGREIARGNNSTTKCLRPLSIYQVNTHLQEDDPRAETTKLMSFRDTYHAPLNPLLNAILMRFVKKDAEPGGDDGLVFDPNTDKVFFLDHLIAGASMVLLLAAMGVSYLLASHIFDRKIGAVTALSMLMCVLLWKFSQSGLPQPLMLFLFSFALYFLYKVVENAQIGRSPFWWAVLSGLFFGLLALAHWITIWAFVGALIYVAIFIRPRGAVALSMLGVFLFIVIWWPLLVNLPATGNPMGSSFYQFYAGLAGGSESLVMRNLNPEQIPFNTDGFIRKIALGTVSQMSQIFTYLGGVIAAPVFFISLFHPFKRPEIANFRWVVLIMWVVSCVGMAIFGIPEGASDPNNIHMLFIPIMAAYGFAMLSVLWSRLSLPMEFAVIRNGHLIIAVLVSAGPMLLSMPWDLMRNIRRDFRANWPPYLPSAYYGIRKSFQPHEVIVSDAPWAVAWYADRVSVWLPRTVDQFETLRADTEAKRYPITGVLLTPLSTHSPYAADIVSKRGEYGEWGPLIENFSVSRTLAEAGARNVSPLNAWRQNWTYRYIVPITGADMVLYTDKPPKP